MLLTLRRAGYVKLEPEPPAKDGACRPRPSRKRRPRCCEWNGSPAQRRQPPPEVAALPAAAGPCDARAGQAAALPQRQSALRHVPRPATGHRRPRRAHPGDGERVGAAAIGRAITCRCRGRTNCPPAPWPPRAWTPQLLQLGLATAEELVMQPEEEDFDPRHTYDEDRVWVLALADKLRRLFDYELPGVRACCGRSRYGRPASCWSSAATSTST